MSAKKYKVSYGGSLSLEEFETFDSAWDFVEAHIPRELHMDIYVVVA